MAILETVLLGGGNLSNHSPLRLSVGFLLRQGVGFSRDFDYDQRVLEVGDDLQLRDLRGSIRFTRTHQGLYAQGTLSAANRQACVRCLEEFDQPLVIDIAELFVYPPGKASDILLTIPESCMLDLGPLVREYMLLEVPLQPVCKPDCLGLCAVCGEDLNSSDCHHPDEEIEPRFSVLKSLLPEA